MKRERKRLGTLLSALRNAPVYSFPRSGQTLQAPIKQGVYVIYGPRGRVLHVGRTPKAKRGLKQRLYDHLINKSSFSRQYLKGQCWKLRKGYKFRCVEVKGRRIRALLEAYAIGCLCPAHIGLSKAADK